jgi:hypothetical protein
MNKVLVFGATYGLLVAHQLDAMGFSVDIVCREIEGNNIEKNRVVVVSNQLNEGNYFHVAQNIKPKKVSQIMDAAHEYDIVILAMSEQCYSTNEISLLLSAIGELNIPVLSVMNLPPLKFMKKLINQIDESDFKDFYNSYDALDSIKAENITHSSADPQIAGISSTSQIKLRLASNFKISAFGNHNDAVLNEFSALSRKNDVIRTLGAGFRVYENKYVGMSKLPMLITGNYRCFNSGGIKSIREIVHTDLKKSERIYEKVCELLVRYGVDRSVLVPFRLYAKAAQYLDAPSSFARAKSSGAERLERVDLLVHKLAERKNYSFDELDCIIKENEEKM